MSTELDPITYVKELRRISDLWIEMSHSIAHAVRSQTANPETLNLISKQATTISNIAASLALENSSTPVVQHI